MQTCPTIKCLSSDSKYKDFNEKHPSSQCYYEVYQKYVTSDMIMSFTKLGHEQYEIWEHFWLHSHSHTSKAKSLDEGCENCKIWQAHIKRAEQGGT